MSRSAIVIACITALALAGCGPSVGGPAASGDLAEDIALKTAPYLVVDLASGAISAHIDIPDLTTNADWRTTKMVFRRVPKGTVTYGAAVGQLGAGSDRASGQAALEAYYCGVFEVTQDQWFLLAGDRPWTTLSLHPADAALVATVADLPAYGLSLQAIDAALASWNAGRTTRLRVPTDNEWERACRAGGSAQYAWGELPSLRSEALAYAVTYETRSSPAPRAVHLRQANAFGFHDMHGNVSEWTSDGNVRGGSWNEPTALARASYRYDLHYATGHALAGVRLVLVP